MNGIAVLLSLAAVGVDYGWQPGVDGQLEYIIQIEPSLLNSMQSGREIVSEIQPEARDVRRFRVRVGTGALPRVGGTAVAHHPRGCRPRTWRIPMAPVAVHPRSRRRHPRTDSGRRRLGADGDRHAGPSAAPLAVRTRR